MNSETESNLSIQIATIQHKYAVQLARQLGIKKLKPSYQATEQFYNSMRSGARFVEPWPSTTALIGPVALYPHSRGILPWE